MRKLIGTLWIAVIAIVSCAVPPAAALSCAPPGPVREEMDVSSVVFKGTAIEVRSDGLTTFRVDTAWKGIDEATVDIYDNGWDPYASGAEYLVFGMTRDGELRTNLCGHSGIWNETRALAMEQESAEPAVMRIADQANGTAESGSTGSRQPTPSIVWSGLLLIAIAAGVYVLWRNDRRSRGGRP